MNKKGKQQPAPALELPVQPGSGSPGPLAQDRTGASGSGLPAPDYRALQEYEFQGVMWRVERFDLLAAEVERIDPALLPEFHAVIAPTARGWQIIRRLFGLRPVVSSVREDPENLRLWGRDELLQTMGLTKPQLREELDQVRGAWQARRQQIEDAARERQLQMEAMAGPADARGNLELNLDDKVLLTQYGFHDVEFRGAEEKTWFAGRVKAMESVLKVKMAEGVARNALMTELRIRQMESQESAKASARDKDGKVVDWVGGREWREFMKFREELILNYQKAIAQLNEWVPWAGLEAGKMDFRGVVSDITEGIQRYKARGDRSKIDGIFELTEVLVECRTSVQQPLPRYRSGLAIFLAAAKQGLWDPNWQCPVKHGVFARFDRATRETFARLEEESGEGKVDLMSDGPDGEYEDLPKMPKAEVAENIQH